MKRYLVPLLLSCSIASCKSEEQQLTKDELFSRDSKTILAEEIGRAHV